MDLQAVADAAAAKFLAAWRDCAPQKRCPQRQQLHVDMMLLRDREEEVADAERYLRPAMRVLADHVPSDVIFLTLELPAHVDAARAEVGPVKMRVVKAEHFTATRFDEVTGEALGFDWVTTVRFDVLIEPA